MIKNELIKNAKQNIQNANMLSPTYIDKMKKALEYFEENGIPTKENEDWLYTSIEKKLSFTFLKENENHFNNKLSTNIISNQAFLLFENGIFNKSRSAIPNGIELDQISFDDNFFDSFDALNSSINQSPVFLKLKKNTTLNAPLTIIYRTNEYGVNKMITPKIYITCEENSKATFFEVFESENKDLFQYTINSNTSIELKENAHLNHIKLNIDATNSTQIILNKISQHKFSEYNSFLIDLGVKLTRHNLLLDLNEAGANARLLGMYALKNEDHCDIYTVVNHNASHTSLHQTYKGILLNASTGAFTGKMLVKDGADKVDSSQVNKNLVLSKKAHVYSRPQLLVSTDDVKCAHGATIGKLSEEEEFYLISRGIKKERARLMLCLGFASDVIYQIPNEDIKNLCIKHFVSAFDKINLENGESTL